MFRNSFKIVTIIEVLDVDVLGKETTLHVYWGFYDPVVVSLNPDSSNWRTFKYPEKIHVRESILEDIKLHQRKGSLSEPYIVP